MPERAEGWYWVRGGLLVLVSPKMFTMSWNVLYWNDGWWLAGQWYPAKDSDFTEIGPRILPPEELPHA
jgi:hypothetical protein